MLKSAVITGALTTIFEAAKDTEIDFLSVCNALDSKGVAYNLDRNTVVGNTNTETVSFSIYLVPAGAQASDANLFLDGIKLDAKRTYTNRDRWLPKFEKLTLSAGDKIVGICTTAGGQLTAVVSGKELA